MPAVLAFVCYLIALTCFALAALDRGRFSDRVNVVALGLALWVLVLLWGAAERLGD